MTSSLVFAALLLIAAAVPLQVYGQPPSAITQQLTPTCKSVTRLAPVSSNPQLIATAIYSAVVAVNCFAWDISPASGGNYTMLPPHCQTMYNETQVTLNILPYGTKRTNPPTFKVNLAATFGGSLLASIYHITAMSNGFVEASQPTRPDCPAVTLRVGIELLTQWNGVFPLFEDMPLIASVQPPLVKAKQPMTITFTRLNPTVLDGELMADRFAMANDTEGCESLTPEKAAKFPPATIAGTAQVATVQWSHAMTNSGLYLLCVQKDGLDYWDMLAAFFIFGGDPSWFTSPTLKPGGTAPINSMMSITFAGSDLDLRPGGDSAKLVSVLYSCELGTPAGGVPQCNDLGGDDSFGPTVTRAIWDVTPSIPGRYKVCYKRAFGSGRWEQVPLFDELPTHSKQFFNDAVNGSSGMTGTVSDTTTETGTASATSTSTATATSTETATPTASSTATESPTETTTSSATITNSSTTTETVTQTPTSTTPTSTMPETATVSPSETINGTTSELITASPTQTDTRTDTSTSTATTTTTATLTGTSTTSVTPSFTATASVTEGAPTTTPQPTTTSAPPTTSAGSTTSSDGTTAVATGTATTTTVGQQTATATFIQSTSVTTTATSSVTTTPTVTKTDTATSTPTRTRTTTPTPLPGPTRPPCPTPPPSYQPPQDVTTSTFLTVTVAEPMNRTKVQLTLALLGCVNESAVFLSADTKPGDQANTAMVVVDIKCPPSDNDCDEINAMTMLLYLFDQQTNASSNAEVSLLQGAGLTQAAADADASSFPVVDRSNPTGASPNIIAHPAVATSLALGILAVVLVIIIGVVLYRRRQARLRNLRFVMEDLTPGTARELSTIGRPREVEDVDTPQPSERAAQYIVPEWGGMPIPVPSPQRQLLTEADIVVNIVPEKPLTD